MNEIYLQQNSAVARNSMGADMRRKSSDPKDDSYRARYIGLGSHDPNFFPTPVPDRPVSIFIWFDAVSPRSRLVRNLINLWLGDDVIYRPEVFLISSFYNSRLSAIGKFD